MRWPLEMGGAGEWNGREGYLSVWPLGGGMWRSSEAEMKLGREELEVASLTVVSDEFAGEAGGCAETGGDEVAGLASRSVSSSDSRETTSV